MSGKLYLKNFLLFKFLCLAFFSETENSISEEVSFKIMESELTKIALVHLYTQGFTGESLTNFELKLTTPSIIFEQEKVALLKEKVDLANQMKDTK